MATLKHTLKDLLTRAREAEERPFRVYLPRGLNIEVTQMKSGDVVLTLERSGIVPSAEEWQTVMAHWPELVPDGVVPTSRKDGRFYRLAGRWPRPAVLGEAFK